MKVTFRIISFYKSLYFHYKKYPRYFLHKNVAYFAQWESPSLVSKIIQREISEKDDPNWKNSGAKTKEEYTLWSRNVCGMACFKMILAYTKKREYPLVVLGKQCMEYGGYRSSDKKRVIDGLFYEPFLRFIKEEYNLRGRVASLLILEEACYELAKGNFVIASVSPQIRNTNARPKEKGGHLVLILGYDLKKKLLYFHNPSGDSKKTQQYAEISFSDFAHFFAERGIVITYP